MKQFLLTRHGGNHPWLKQTWLKTMGLLVGLAFSSLTLSAQQGNVTGKVTSADEGDPLPGVSVVVKGTTTGTQTDLNGSYTIAAAANSTLVFSYIGMQAQEVAVGNRTTVDIQLEPDVKALSEVVVTALGVEQQRRTLGYSVQEVQSRELSVVKQPNVVNALRGQVAGVQINSAGGGPGSGCRVVIRGITSLNPNADNQPLFVVDGIPIDNSTDAGLSAEATGARGDARAFTNRAADINPNDIENISVLKGPSATALYGIRAANGVVLITTKKGKAGKTTVNVSTSVGLDEVNKYPDLQKTYLAGWFGQPTFQGDAPFHAYGPRADTVPGATFYDNFKNFFRTGVQLNNSVDISGGNEKATFYTSLSNFTQRGIIPASDYKRTTAKLSGNINFSERLRVVGSVNYINSGGNRVSPSVMDQLSYYPTSIDVRQEYNEDGTQYSYSPILGGNPLYYANHVTYEDDVNRLIGNLSVDYKLTSWLSVLYRLGNDFYSDSRVSVLPGPSGIEGDYALDSRGVIEETRINSRDLTSTLLLTANKRFSDKFGATLRVGNDVFDRKKDILFVQGTTFQVPNFYDLSNVAQVISKRADNNRRVIGVYGDLMLDYNNMLYLNLTGRNDWSSTLPVANRSFFYPAVNAGFVFSEAFKLPAFFTFGKVRASIAQVGKDAPAYSTGITYESPENFPLNGVAGFTKSETLGDPNLKPERTTSVEVGADLRFFDNRLGVDVTWYKSNSRDQIIPVPISSTTGFNTFLTNAGELQNTGLEVVLRGTVIQSSDFNWNITANFTRNRNKVISIREGIESIALGETSFQYAAIDPFIQLVPGRPYGNILGTSYQRYYAPGETENPDVLDKSRSLLVGANGFPVLDNSAKIIGNITPDWLLGITNSVTYKSLSLSFLIDIRHGGDVYNQYENFFISQGTSKVTENRNQTLVFDGFLENGERNTKAVWLGQGVNPGDGVDYGNGYYRNFYRRASENFVEDASWVRLRNLSLSYSLPKKWLGNGPFSNVNLTLTGNNLLLFTDYNGFDPESTEYGSGSNAAGFQGKSYPQTRSYFVTLNFSL